MTADGYTLFDCLLPTGYPDDSAVWRSPGSVIAQVIQAFKMEEIAFNPENSRDWLTYWNNEETNVSETGGLIPPDFPKRVIDLLFKHYDFSFLRSVLGPRIQVVQTRQNQNSVLHMDLWKPSSKSLGT